ncbi:glycine--tRNA ligase [Candidatus Pacearchaeota archaeon]|nr:glycine--tRNA ligase [Candidatus Pacearchaeota archaeon]
MVFIVKKKINGQEYYYLRASTRVIVNGKTKVKAVNLGYFGKDRKKAEQKLFEMNWVGDNKLNKLGFTKQIMAEKNEKKFEENKIEAEFRKALMSFVVDKGFVYGPSPEIYGGMAGFYDFGPAGKTLKNNIENAIRRLFNKFQFFEVECPIVTPKIVWEASGHLGGFSDPLVKCTKCTSIWRVDNLIGEEFKVDADAMTLEQLKEFLKTNQVICPSCKNRLSDDVKKHSLMLKTQVGLDTEMYNRPETATTTYLPFLNYLRFYRERLPFGVFQIGNAYRNEISPRQHIIRGREFTQAEAQVFLFKDQKENFEKFSEVEDVVIPFFTAKNQKENKGITSLTLKKAMENKVLKNKAYAWTIAITYQLFKSLGFSDENLRYKQHMPEKLAFYADDAWDLEIKFNSFGWVEACGVHDRTDYDLTTHGKFSGKELMAINPLTNKKEIPNVLEIAIGPNRVLLGVLDNFYDKRSEEEGKTKLRIPVKLSPIKAAILPLMKKEPLLGVSRKVFEDLSNEFLVVSDETGSIGKRYLRQDALGTPICITVDYDTIEKDDSVTIRERDSEKQIRVKISELHEVVRKVIEGEDLLKLGKLVETRVKE